MYPTIFTYKMITIGGFGIMLGLGFYLAFLLLERELSFKGVDPDLAFKIILVAIVGGITGAKLFHVMENFSEFLRDPKAMLFSGAGLSVYGGFIVAILLNIPLIIKNKVHPLIVLDGVAPCLAIGYAVGRLGCHVAGDGCYGIATSSFLGAAYPNGLIPSSVAVLPTPLIESFVSFMFVALLLRLRKFEFPVGVIFFVYFILNGFARFFIEFVRTNREAALGLSHAQFIAIGFVITGSIGLVYSLTRAKAEG
ncbi:MAG: prolipoprotein diacylglyceryl transferase [bacterium]|nr:prolipoprotein diacylglyceryl transferase [bacterium]